MISRFVQGRPSSTAVEQFVERNLPHLVKMEEAITQQEASRLRNVLTMGKMRELFIRHDYRSAFLKLADSDYYDKSLEDRARFLQSPVDNLCKTMIMENTSYNTEYEGYLFLIQTVLPTIHLHDSSVLCQPKQRQDDESCERLSTPQQPRQKSPKVCIQLQSM